MSSPGPRAEVSTTNKLDKVAFRFVEGTETYTGICNVARGAQGARETPGRSTWPHLEKITEDLLEEVTLLVS